MIGYRLYLRDAHGIVGRDDFHASDDDTAAAIAEGVSEACADKSDGYELWQDRRWVVGRRTAASRPPANAAEIIAKAQASVIAGEEALQKSRWAVARSQRLLERLKALRNGSIGDDRNTRERESDDTRQQGKCGNRRGVVGE
jgi:uncharacterized protein CbrC (UPF0167 family)